MSKTTSSFKAFVNDENAVTAIEYALVAALLVTSIAIAVKIMSDHLVALFTSVGAMFVNIFP